MLGVEGETGVSTLLMAVAVGFGLGEAAGSAGAHPARTKIARMSVNCFKFGLNIVVLLEFKNGDYITYPFGSWRLEIRD